MYRISDSFPDDIVFEKEKPCISLYQPTHRHHPGNKQDPIVFKNLMRSIEQSLKLGYDGKFADAILKPLHELKEDTEFWNKTMEGIAVLANRNGCVVFHLYDPVKEFAVVADSFHLKPLLKAFQAPREYQALGLSRENFVLYQGNRSGLQELTLEPGTPRTMKEVLGDQLSESYLTHGSHGGTGGPAIFHGHGEASQEIEKDTEKYFRHVDAFVLNNYSKKSKLPLILIALTEHHSLFRSLSVNPYLLGEGIEKSIESLDMDEIRKKAEEIVEKPALRREGELVEAYAKAEAEALGSRDLKQVVKAACEGRVETLLIEEDKLIPGKIDREAGEIRPADIGHPENDDILDDLAELVLEFGGAAVVLAKEGMPGDSGVAAVFRYK